MQQAEYDHNVFSNTAEADKSLMVRFFYKNVANKLESEAQGRPIFKEKVYIEIRIAGQRDAQACRPATYADKQRFAAHLEAFEKRVEPPTEGTPLVEWPMISRTQAEELSFLHVKTVEQLAGVSDANIQNIMGGYGLREKAQKWLVADDVETVIREKEEMAAQIEKLQAQVAELLQAMSNTRVPDASVNAADLSSKLDQEPEEEKIEGAAVKVPAAPAAKKARSRRTKN